MDTADDDDGRSWTDTFVSSTHWIDCIDYGKHSIPEEFSAAAIRNGGAVIIALRLRNALSSLIEACDQEPGRLGSMGGEIARAKAVLAELPAQIGN